MKLTAATKIISCLCVHPFERFERALKIVSDEIRLYESCNTFGRSETIGGDRPLQPLRCPQLGGLIFGAYEYGELMIAKKFLSREHFNGKKWYLILVKASTKTQNTQVITRALIL